MTVTIRVKPNAQRQSITTTPSGELVIAVHESPEKGKANAAVIRALAKHLHLAPSRLTIVRGATSRRKVIEIT